MEDLELEGCVVARSELPRQPQILEAQPLILVLLQRGCAVARSELLRQPQILEAQPLSLVLLQRKGSVARQDVKALLVNDALQTLLIFVVHFLLQQIALPQGSEFLLQIFGLVAHAAHLPSVERPPSSP